MIQFILAGEPQRRSMPTVYKRGSMLWIRGTQDKKQHILPTGKIANQANLTWLERNKERVFAELINKSKANVSQKFSGYGKYVLEITSKDRKTKSEKDNQRKLEKLCEFFGNMQLGDIRSTDIKRWQNMMLGQYSPKSVINFRSVLSLVLKYALDDELIFKNPLSVVKTPPRAKVPPNTYGLNEVKKILEVTNGQFANILKFNFFSGLRSGELIALKWSKINFESGTIIIDERFLDGETDLPKGDKVRIIQITPPAMEALKAQRLKTGLRDHVFISEQTNQHFKSSKTLDEHFKKACELAEVKIGKLYNTRYSFATLMLQMGMSESWLIQQMGHIDIQVTREHYLSSLKADFSSFDKIAI
jgi:integrase